jgi:membrane-bound serine protease (ClpP class)
MMASLFWVGSIFADNIAEPEVSEVVGAAAVDAASETPALNAPNEAEATQAQSSEQKWLSVEIGIIGVASNSILEDAMKMVGQGKFTGLLIKLDTPGGSLDSTRSMVKQIINATFPVIVWVGPKGARAASAGAFITLAGHVAVMAEGTNIGAAHPVSVDGSDASKADSTKKVINDTVAFIESIAKARGRSEEMARSFVVASTSITAEEALEHKVIDLISSSEEDIFAKLVGRKVPISSSIDFTFDAAKVEITEYKKTLKQRFLEILSNPNLFYLFFVAGIIGLGFELTHPGSIFPGVLGGICMILALMATSVLPINFAAMALVLVGIAFMVGEAFLPSFGVLGIGGFVAFVIGSFLLVDFDATQNLRIAWYVIAPVAVLMFAMSLFIGYLLVRSFKSKVQIGEGMLNGEDAEVVADFVTSDGQVRVKGEIWRATLVSTGEDSSLPKRGETLMVKETQGLKLLVTRK